KYQANVNNIPLDITKEFTYQVLDGLLTEMAGLYPENFMHLGGDEVVTGCYLNNQSIVDWMKQNGYSSILQVIGYFETRLHTLVTSKLGKRFVGWQELFDAYNLNLPKDVIIEVWKDESIRRS